MIQVQLAWMNSQLSHIHAVVLNVFMPCLARGFGLLMLSKNTPCVILSFNFITWSSGQFWSEQCNGSKRKMLKEAKCFAELESSWLNKRLSIVPVEHCASQCVCESIKTIWLRGALWSVFVVHPVSLFVYLFVYFAKKIMPQALSPMSCDFVIFSKSLFGLSIL